MATAEAEVISALCENKDVHAILGEEPELFGSWANVVEFVKDYYNDYKGVPDSSIIETKFEVELPETTAPTAYYVQQVKNMYLETHMGTIANKILKNLGKRGSGEILQKAQRDLAALGKYTNMVRDLDLTDVDAAAEYLERLREKSEANDGSPGIKTGFDSIDTVYPTGMAPGHSIVVMGYTGRAKSMWADVLAVKAWEQGYRPMIISLEMSPEEQRERVYAMMSSGLFKISDLSRGDIVVDDLKEWGRQRFRDKNNFVICSNEGIRNVTPNVVQAKIDIHKPDLVILDYMQLMMDNAMTGAMTPRMLNLSREIKMLATSNNIPTVSITAVTDDENDKREGPPRLDQISWSSGIEYDANLAIAIHRFDDSNLVECVGRKSRHGPLFSFYFDVQFNEGVWREVHDISELNQP